MEDRDEKGRFAPGWSGGPGRPKKGESFTDALREIVDKKELAVRLRAMALEDNNFVALKYIYDRLDGAPMQKTENVNFNLPAVIEVGEDENTPDTEDMESVEES